jgi:hypothetical protein
MESAAGVSDDQNEEKATLRSVLFRPERSGEIGIIFTCAAGRLSYYAVGVSIGKGCTALVFKPHAENEKIDMGNEHEIGTS